MGYNSLNKLKKIWVIQEYYTHCNKQGITTVLIIKNINKIWPISTQCFYNWLGINARKQLKEAEADQNELNELLERFRKAIEL